MTSYSKLKLAGVIVPLLTPLRPDESLDEDGLGRLIEYVLLEGADGIFVLGTTGEFALLDRVTRNRLIECAVARTRGRAPVLVGVSAAGTKLAVESGREAVALGADAIVATAPFYFPHTQTELIAHFSAIAAEVDAPLALYNIPHRVKLALEPATVRKLAEIPNVVGLKDSSGDLEVLREFLNVRRERPDFSVAQGGEFAAASGVRLGADGLALGPSNIAPRLCRELFAAAKAGRQRLANELQTRLTALCAIYRHKSGIAGMKAAAQLLGLCQAVVCTPFEPLAEEQIEQVRQTLISVGVLGHEPIPA